jgi:hypothetical protein
MLRQQLANLLHFAQPDCAALNNNLCFGHIPSLTEVGVGVPKKRKLFF